MKIDIVGLSIDSVWFRPGWEVLVGKYRALQKAVSLHGSVEHQEAEAAGRSHASALEVLSAQVATACDVPTHEAEWEIRAKIRDIYGPLDQPRG